MQTSFAAALFSPLGKVSSARRYVLNPNFGLSSIYTSCRPLTPTFAAFIRRRTSQAPRAALGSVSASDYANVRKQQLAKLKKSLQQPLSNTNDPFFADEGDNYLAQWLEDSYLKPRGYDASASFPIPSTGADVAAVSVGGRNNGQWKLANQDAFLLHSFDDQETSTTSNHTAASSFLVGVFDGHGKLGHEVAARARASMVSRASTTPPPPPQADVDEHEQWLAHCFAEAADNVDGADADYSRSGAAAVVCAVQPGRVTAAWAGDSRAVLGLHGGFTATEESSLQNEENDVNSEEHYYSTLRPIRAVIPLTKDHKPDPFSCPKEAQRILASGGRVDRLATDREGNPIGPFRVFLPHAWTPGLALSRAFGDHIARDIGIVATPDINTLSIPTMSNLATPACLEAAGGGDGSDSSSIDKIRHHNHVMSQVMSQHHRHVLVVASDGLWEWISSEEAVAVAWQYPSARAAAEALTERAKKEWAVRYRGTTCDDITVAVAFLPAH
jgi:serine/threonine protein phosphatase PrpC